ncbi:MAG: response regulator [Sphingobacteriales bacterium]|nr:MAG: response regulator [Sphingobacteriales bacterium]
MPEYKYQSALLIDDNEIDSFINKKLLQKTNFSQTIVEVYSAIKGLEFLRENKDNPEKLPDIIFLDIMMPVMDGFDFLDEYDKLPQEIKSKPKIIMLSSTESFKDLNRANSNKYVYKFLNKPLTEPALAAIH